MLYAIIASMLCFAAPITAVLDVQVGAVAIANGTQQQFILPHTARFLIFRSSRDSDLAFTGTDGAAVDLTVALRYAGSTIYVITRPGNEGKALLGGTWNVFISGTGGAQTIAYRAASDYSP
jgi:hypothetical protein